MSSDEELFSNLPCSEIKFSLNPIPAFYRPPHGLPLYWRDETSGQLSAAIFSYLNFITKKVLTPPTEEQIWLIRCYLEHFIMAPCWMEYNGNSLSELRELVKDVNSVETIDKWLRKAMEIALDPL